MVSGSLDLALCARRRFPIVEQIHNGPCQDILSGSARLDGHVLREIAYYTQGHLSPRCKENLDLSLFPVLLPASTDKRPWVAKTDVSTPTSGFKRHILAVLGPSDAMCAVMGVPNLQNYRLSIIESRKDKTMLTCHRGE